MRNISIRLSAMSLDERRELPCIGHERADLVVAGCAILECILDIWPAERLGVADRGIREGRSEEHTSELQSLMRISYAVFCLKKKTTPDDTTNYNIELALPIPSTT